MLVFALLGLVNGAVVSNGSWEKLSDRDGVLIERLLHDGGLYELRATVHASVTPEQFAETLWKHEDYPKFVPHLSLLQTLKTVGNERWNYEQIHMPVVSDRDYIVHLTRLPVDPATGIIEIHFVSAPNEGPPPSPKFVRMTKIKGGWTVEPSDQGGCDVTYDLFSDPGGGVPQWIINSAQKDASRDFVLAMVKRAKDTHK